jgi:ADP-ribose pyrophosphatase YjhB (NUDIX family)
MTAKMAAVSMITREDGRLLCVWNRRYGGWSLPGGLVEEGESLEQAQERELREETGLETVLQFVLYCGPAVVLPDGKGRASMVTVFDVTVRGVPSEREPGCPVTWVTREEFLKWTPFAAFYQRMFREHPFLVKS